MVSSYFIRVSSQKGGVGKTTVSVNLAVALAVMGYKTLLIDGDLTNPSVGFHLGLEEANVSYDDVLMGRAKLTNATVTHAPSGLKVLPGRAATSMSMPTVLQMERFMKALEKAGYDFAIIDTAPGLQLEAGGKHINYALILSTPDMPSCASSVRLSTLYKKGNIQHGLVLNKIKNKSYELDIREIEQMYGDRITATLPEDEVIPISIEQHIPAYILNKASKFSKGIKDLANICAYKTGKSVYDVQRGQVSESWWTRLKRMLFKRGA